jgi:cell division protein FtsN
MFKESESEQEQESVPDHEDELRPLSEIFEQIYQPKINTENIIPEEVRQLHKEIEEEPPAVIINEEKIEEKPDEPVWKEEEVKTAETEIPEEPHQKEKLPYYLKTDDLKYATDDNGKSLFKSPLFIVPLIFIILLVITVSVYFVYNKFYVKKLQTAKQEITAVSKDTVKSSGNIDSSQIKDTNAVDKNAKTETKTEVKEESRQKEIKEEKTDKTVPDVTMIKNFVVIKDKDGIYLQVASLKEKSSADTKAATINKKGIIAKVVEADLGEKGKYYRVRVGPFKNIDEAKTAANKID